MSFRKVLNLVFLTFCASLLFSSIALAASWDVFPYMMPGTVYPLQIGTNTILIHETTQTNDYKVENVTVSNPSGDLSVSALLLVDGEYHAQSGLTSLFDNIVLNIQVDKDVLPDPTTIPIELSIDYYEVDANGNIISPQMTDTHTLNVCLSTNPWPQAGATSYLSSASEFDGPEGNLLKGIGYRYYTESDETLSGKGRIIVAKTPGGEVIYSVSYLIIDQNGDYYLRTAALQETGGQLVELWNNKSVSAITPINGVASVPTVIGDDVFVFLNPVGSGTDPWVEVYDLSSGTLTNSFDITVQQVQGQPYNSNDTLVVTSDPIIWGGLLALHCWEEASGVSQNGDDLAFICAVDQDGLQAIAPIVYDNHNGTIIEVNDPAIETPTLYLNLLPMGSDGSNPYYITESDIYVGDHSATKYYSLGPNSTDIYLLDTNVNQLVNGNPFSWQFSIVQNLSGSDFIHCYDSGRLYLASTDGATGSVKAYSLLGATLTVTLDGAPNDIVAANGKVYVSQIAYSTQDGIITLFDNNGVIDELPCTRSANLAIAPDEILVVADEEEVFLVRGSSSPNTPPTISAIADQGANYLDTLSIPFTCTDVDGYINTITLSGPFFLSIVTGQAGDYTIEGQNTINPDVDFDCTVTVTATDNNGDSAQESFVLTLYSDPNQYPVNTVVTTDEVTVVQTVEVITTVEVEVEDPDGISPESNPPETTLEISGTLGNDNWYVSAVTLTLTAVDDTAVANVYYQINEGDIIALEYDGPKSATVQVQGEFDINYYAKDIYNNAEDPKSVTVKIDTVAPEIDLRLNDVALSEITTLTQNPNITGNIIDESSGLADVEILVDGINQGLNLQTLAQALEVYEENQDIVRAAEIVHTLASALSAGDRSIEVRATDNAGNRADAQGAGTVAIVEDGIGHQNPWDPTNGPLTVNIDVPEDGNLDFTIFNITGSKVWQYTNYLTAGAHDIQVNKTLQSGLYLAFATINGRRFASSKIIVIRENRWSSN